MAEREYGPPCPGCTREKITAQIERMPQAYALCIACRDHGPLFHARHKTERVQEDAQERSRRESGIADGPIRQAQSERSDG